MARDNNALVLKAGTGSAEATDTVAPASTTSTLRATITGQSPEL